MPITSK